jgi:hypothetical protein
VTQLQFSREELLSELDYAQPHVVGGRRMHGGLLADGTYQPPRSAGRTVALDAWTKALRSRGGELFDANSSLLDGDRIPSVEQSRVLLRHGLGETFWNSLTIIGKIEAKGRLLADIEFPDLQPFIVDDISHMAIGHLNKGLLFAHGIDEGGQPDIGIGGHDEMWFVARDLVFGAGAFADDVEPALLIIEFRAEIGFISTQEVVRTPDLFTDRRADAELAAVIVERIRTDETIHISSLQLYLGELRTVRFKTLEGGEISGAELIDRFWGGLVHWATVEQPRQFAAIQSALIEDRIALAANADQILAEFRAAA